ncbi:hypothetical protein BD311DRAFT_811227 [Dichomitus squalens]|uniref:Uncharacterized protein n=1 Tax=Dichomitus squalens TaxID=114155 RepID=A0A4Q9M715_9APHY|nr:hypothetical protein BD311DRAFT_811227 [Dichomitus squalens]
MNSSLSHALRAPAEIALHKIPENAVVVEEGGSAFVKIGSKWRSQTRQGVELPLQQQFRPGAVMQVPYDREAIYVFSPQAQRWLLANPRPDGSFLFSGHTQIKVVPHQLYASRNFNGDPEEVRYNLSLGLLETNWGQVANADAVAFTGELTTKAKATIRYQFERWPYNEEQVHLQRGGKPITRGELAFVIAQQMKKLIMEMKARNQPLRFDNSNREVMLSDLVLISVKRVAEGSVQAILGIRQH